MSNVLEVSDLSIKLSGGGRTIEPVRDVVFTVGRGETLAILGESGSGKSLTALALLGLLPANTKPKVAGQIRFKGADITGLDRRAWRALRGTEIGMVFQDPLGAMNPSMTVGRQISEMFSERRGMPRKEARTAALEVMQRVRIPDAASRYDSHPHQFSGGMRQRAMIAMAIALEPDLLLADEPTTALDVTVQAGILELISDLRRDTGMGVVLISHDLAVVATFADRVMVMYSGSTIEAGPTEAVLRTPRHPYTVGLQASSPRRNARRNVEPIPGTPPSPVARPAGCAFHPRCSRATDICRTTEPPLRAIDEDHLTACHHAEDLAVA
jgi:oligopeptide transport system ATP-binding protein